MQEKELLNHILAGEDSYQFGRNTTQSILDLMNRTGIDSFKPEVLSREVQKRLGLYSIVNAEINVSSKIFEELVSRSFKMGNTLGYFVDFSLVGSELRKQHASKRYFKPLNNGYLSPNRDYSFNGASFARTVGTYGGWYALLGSSFEYKDGHMNEWLKSSSKPAAIPHSDNFRGTDELVQTPGKIVETHNNNLRAMGKPLIHLSRSGNLIFNPNYSNTLRSRSRSPGTSTTADTLALGVNYWAGARNGFENATQVQMPSWSINGMNFFTVVGKQIHSIEHLGGGRQNIITRPDFYSAYRMMNDVQVNNYSNWLDSEQSGWQRFWRGTMRGWWK